MNEEVKTETKKGMSRGCLIGLIVAGILVIIVIGSGIVCYVYQDELLEWGLEKTTEMIALEIKANLPEEITEQDVDELFEKLKQAIKNKEIDPSKIQKLATQFQMYLEDQKIDEDEARAIMEEIKEVVEF
ncbi:MAG: hypothetical protein DRP51_04945 [Candidatus Zixiibacteriota bacterium]|nr:MAG: hypothetical protein DRP51_04945 [candidate division Zixibacteria bacterium]